jgi:hypothetical protein
VFFLLCILLILSTISFLLSPHPQSVFCTGFFLLHLILYARTPEKLCSVTLLTICGYLRTDVYPLICDHLLFKSSSHNLYVSGHFDNRRDAHSFAQRKYLPLFVPPPPLLFVSKCPRWAIKRLHWNNKNITWLNNLVWENENAECVLALIFYKPKIVRVAILPRDWLMAPEAWLGRLGSNVVWTPQALVKYS